MSIQEVVRSKYASVAKSRLSSEHEGVRAIAEAFGYSPDELASIPAEANMGLSCGNPNGVRHATPRRNGPRSRLRRRVGCISRGGQSRADW